MTNDISIGEIPMPFRERFVELIEIINDFCDTHLNDDYIPYIPADRAAE